MINNVHAMSGLRYFAVLMSIVGYSLVVVGCASQPYNLEAKSSSYQATSWSEGIKVLISQRNTSQAMIRPLKNEQRKEPTLLLQVRNTGSQPFTLSPETIKANYMPDESFVSTQLNVYTYEEAKAKEENESMATATAAVGLLTAVAEGMAAADGTSLNTTSSSTEMIQLAEKQEREADATIDKLRTTLLRKETVRPGGSHGGYILLEKPQNWSLPAELNVDVAAGADTHTFKFRVTGK